LICGPSILFSMNLDIYYSTESQDDFGIENKSWRLDQTLLGYAENLGAVEKDSLKNNMFFEYENKLIGRTIKDPRVSLEGIYYPITNILITNIQDVKNRTIFYVESDGRPTVYELTAVEPYVNPWNEIEYYKILFNRSDRQDLSND
jgi:hypothetical protein